MAEAPLTFEGLRPPYGCIVADPPWAFSGNSAAKPGRNALRHYKTMKVTEIAAMNIRDLAADDCWLFLWITGPHLATGAHLTVLKAWGFRVSTIAFTWTKLKRGYDSGQFRMAPPSGSDLHFGGGLTTRKNNEFVILGRRGRPVRAAKNVPEAILESVKEHSRKPDEFKRRVDRFIGPGVSVVELFSRQAWRGWDAWGDQAGKFDLTTK